MRLYHGDCLDILPHFGNKIVDCVITDLPYGITQQSFDKCIDLEEFWPEIMRIAKPNAAILMFGMQPFVTDLINSNRKYFRYEIIMEKTHPQGFLNCNNAPLKAHENIEVFYKKQPTYNPQKTYGHKKYHVEYKRDYDMSNYGKSECGRKGKICSNDGSRHPKSVILSSNSNNRMVHPHGKEIDILRYLIRTYTNPGMTILDATFGGLSCGIAAELENRKFIGIEKEEFWFNLGVERAREFFPGSPNLIKVCSI